MTERAATPDASPALSPSGGRQSLGPRAVTDLPRTPVQGAVRLRWRDDAALLAAMRDGDARAWGEFYARYRELVSDVVRLGQFTDPGDEEAVRALAEDILTDESTALVDSDAPPGRSLAGYLVRATRHRLVDLRRRAARRRQWYSRSVRHDAPGGEAVLEPLCSSYALTVSAGRDDLRDDEHGNGESLVKYVREVAGEPTVAPATDAPAPPAAGVRRPRGRPPKGGGAPGASPAWAARVGFDPPPSDGLAAEVGGSPDVPPPLELGGAGVSYAVRELAEAIRAGTSDAEWLLITWAAQRVSYQVIADWLSVAYDTAAKRVWRLVRRARDIAQRHVATLDPASRAEVDRYLRRAGGVRGLVAAVSPPAIGVPPPQTPPDKVRDEGTERGAERKLAPRARRDWPGRVQGAAHGADCGDTASPLTQQLGPGVDSGASIDPTLCPPRERDDA